MAFGNGTVVEPLTTNLQIKGSNPAPAQNKAG
jgi:hypothetical protein